MNSNKHRNSSASDCHFLRSKPLYFCTPKQASALLSEGRCLLLFVRHGLTDWNMQMRLQGRENVPLNDGGREQAKELSEVLLSALMDKWHINGIYTSPLSRAEDTAVYISEKLKVPHTVTDGLIERDYSTLSGLTIHERREKFPSPKDYPADMENVTEAAQRIKKVALDLCENGNAISGATLAVTHGGVINALFSYLTRGRAGVGKNVAKNCSISIVASGLTDIIPLAFNLHGDEVINYINEIK